MSRRNLLLRLRWASKGIVMLGEMKALFAEAARELERLTPKVKPRRLR